MKNRIKYWLNKVSLKKKRKPMNKPFKIEDMRIALSAVSTWLTFDEHTSYFKGEGNKVTSERGQILKRNLVNYATRNRKLLNALSESLEDTFICRRNLRDTIEREKEMRKNRGEVTA